MTNFNDENKLSDVVADDENSVEILPVALKESLKNTFDLDDNEKETDQENEPSQLENQNKDEVSDDFVELVMNVTISDNDSKCTQENEIKDQACGEPLLKEKDTNKPCTKTSINETNSCDVEEFIIKQLKENLRDRLFMLNIERSLINFLNEEKQEFYKFIPMNRYYRMFVHRIGEYFGLEHNLDQTKQCIVVNKTKNTIIPKNSFQSIISQANIEIEMPPNPNTTQSPQANSSPERTPDENPTDQVQKNQANDTTSHQTKTKHTILKREANLHDSSNHKNKNKHDEQSRPKTFEEKSAEYIRAKKRIFNNETPTNDSNNKPKPLVQSTSSNSSSPKPAQKFTILNRQSSGNSGTTSRTNQTAQHNEQALTEPAKPTGNGHSEIIGSSQNGGNPSPRQPSSNQKNNLSHKYSQRPNQGYFQKHPNSNFPTYQKSSREHYKHLPGQKSFTIAHPNLHHQQQPQFIISNNIITSNSMQEVSQLSMHNTVPQHHQQHNQQPLFVVNNQQYGGYINMIPPEQTKSQIGFQNQQQLRYFPIHRKESQSSMDQINDGHRNYNSQEFSNLQININQPILSHNHFNNGIPPPPFQNQPIVPHLPYQLQPIINSVGMPQLTHVILNQNGSHFQNQANSNIPQVPINHPMSNMHPNLGYQSVENQHQNFSNKQQQTQALPKQQYNEYAQKGRKPNDFSKIQQTGMYQQGNSQPLLFHHQQMQHQNQQNSFGQLTASLSSFNSNRQYGHNHSSFNGKASTLPRKFPHNQMSHNSDLNLKQRTQNKKIEQTSKKKTTQKVHQETSSKKKPDPKLLASNSSSNLTVQVYNLKQNLTKQMLHDLLEPYVSTIDFKKKLETNSNDVTDGNNTTINEDQVEVFIKFKNLDKLNEALKSFNLKELDSSNCDLEEVASTKVESGASDFSGNNNLAKHQLSDQSPFLFRPLTIF